MYKNKLLWIIITQNNLQNRCRICPYVNENLKSTIFRINLIIMNFQKHNSI